MTENKTTQAGGMSGNVSQKNDHPGDGGEVYDFEMNGDIRDSYGRYVGKIDSDGDIRISDDQVENVRTQLADIMDEMDVSDWASEWAKAIPDHPRVPVYLRYWRVE